MYFMKINCTQYITWTNAGTFTQHTCAGMWNVALEMHHCDFDKQYCQPQYGIRHTHVCAVLLYPRRWIALYIESICVQEQWTVRSRGFLQDFVNGGLHLQATSSSDDELIDVSSQTHGERTSTSTSWHVHSHVQGGCLILIKRFG